MSITQKILLAIQETIQTGAQVKVDLREASAITGSGDGVGGRTYFDDAFSRLRYANPIREYARQIAAAGSSVQFVAKVGNAASPTNAWSYTVDPNSGSPDIDTNIWQLPTRVISAQLPIRTAVMSDVNYLNEAIVQDLMLEFSTIEAQSMVSNNDQSGSTTTDTGAENGLRGLNYYNSGSVSDYGTSGTAITNGIHTIATINQGAATVSYNDIVELASALPAAYWNFDSTCWMMHPTTILALRELTGGSGMPVFLEVGDEDGSAVGNIFGHRVIVNPYLDEVGVNKYPIYLADWSRFVSIADVEEMTIQAMEQTQPGFITLYAEKRLVSTVRDPFAGVRLTWLD
jgi:HK97 family phage major capsid protein